uniref:Uncharacterized protein n=1 Tax=Arundo donax TaxID=35708 RepID=A0A0A9AGP0_ARUDO
MVGRLAAAHPRPGQPGPSVVPPAGCPHAQVHHPARLQNMHLAGIYLKRCSGNLRARHPLQSPRKGEQLWWQYWHGDWEQAAVLEHPGGPMGSYPSHPPRWAGGNDWLRNRRQRAVDEAHRDLGVPGRGRLVRLLQVVAQLQRLEAIGGRDSSLRHRGRQLQREAIGSQQS